MTEHQIQLVKKTWKTFKGISPAIIGDLFYTKLFHDNPGLRKMFPMDMERQYEKLIVMLHAIIIRLDKLEEVSDEIVAMGKRHVNYGVRPAHYKLIGKTLLWTLERGLGAEWTDEVTEAWNACYTLLANTMINSTSLPNTK